MDIVLATKNKNKRKEILAIVKDLKLSLSIELLDAYPEVPDVVEDGHSFEDNATKKALEVAQYTQKLTLADDSGLCVDILNGAPGIYSARFAGEAQDDGANNQKLLDELKGCPPSERRAQFVCSMAIAKPHKLIKVITGRCEGVIAEELAGTKGFGYDALFYYPPLKKTFAELSRQQKNKVSHRAKALIELSKLLKHLLG